ncbi:MAG TPA: helix-turn-helix domain-containing protein, partial [Candidatus Paceibacterota bacterium]
GYVALSRVRTLEGISLVGFNGDSLRVDPKVLEFDQDLKNQSFSNELMFKKLKSEEQKKMEEDFINRMGGTIQTGNKKVKNKLTKNIKIPSIIITKELLEKGKNIDEIVKERSLVKGTIIQHIEDIMKKYPDVNIEHIKPKSKDVALVKKANDKLKDDEKGKLSPIKSILDKGGSNISFDEIRIAKLFI